MIEAYVGLIGGGKTFNAEAKIAEYIASGGVVCTNIQQMLGPWYNHRYADKLRRFKVPYPVDAEHLHWEDGSFWANARGLEWYLRNRYGWELQAGQLIDLDNDQIGGALHEHLPAGTASKPVLVVIDEAVDYFDADERAGANKEFLTFLRYSRKLCIDIIMIAQEFTELNKRIRNQIQWVWTFKDLGVERVPVLRINYPPPYRFNIACAQWSGRRYGNAGEEPVRLAMRWKDQDIFGCYRTEELFREVKVLRGVKTDFSSEGKPIGKGKQMNKWERMALAACLAVSVLGLVRQPKVQAEEIKVAVEEVEKRHKPEQASPRQLAEDYGPPMPLEYIVAYRYDTDGRGSITTEWDTYSVGQKHMGRMILRVIEDGYLYQDEGGTLRSYRFPKRPKAPRPESVGNGTATASATPTASPAS